MKLALVSIVLLAIVADNTFAQHRKSYNVVLRSNVGSHTLWDGVTVPIFGMAIKLSADPTLPAPTLYCNEGDTLVLNALAISQGDHHTIHLHGMDADTKDDGDPATSFSLAHMQTFPYTVVADHAGTYIYHCHETDVIHVQMGMYGLVVVRPKDSSQTAWTGGPRYDKTVSWLLSELDSSWHKNVPKHDTVADTIHVPPYRPSYFLINGKSDSQISGDTSIELHASVGNEVYVRLANIGFFYDRIIFPAGLHARIIDSDGRPLEDSILTDTVEIAPGERYGVMLSVKEATTGRAVLQYVNMNTDSVWNTQYVSIILPSQSVKVNPAKTLHIYPNPTRQVLTIEGAQPYSTYELLDCLGRKVSSGFLEEDNLIDVSSLPVGMYLIKTSGILQQFIRE